MAGKEEVAIVVPADATSDDVLRECTARTAVLNEVFNLPPIVERLDTQAALTLRGRSDRLFRLKDDSYWHVEWQGKRDPAMFERMIQYWTLARSGVAPKGRIRSTVVLVGGAPRDWVIQDWIGDRLVPIPVVDFRSLDPTPLFDRGNTSDMLIGTLAAQGTRDDRVARVVSSILTQPEHERGRLLGLLGRMIELSGRKVTFPPGVIEMIEAVIPDWKRNPVFRPSFEAGVREERRRHALSLMDIARPAQKDRNRTLAGSVPDERLEELVQALTNMLTVRTEEAKARLEQILAVAGP